MRSPFIGIAKYEAQNGLPENYINCLMYASSNCLHFDSSLHGTVLHEAITAHGKSSSVVN